MTATLVAGENKQKGEIIIPATVTYKGREFSVIAIDGAFSDNTELAAVKLHNSIVSLGTRAFEGCSSLHSISGLENITKLGEACFSGCESLISIDLPESLKTIDKKAFSGCTRLTSLAIPNNVNSIGSQAFQNCSSITSIKLPANLLTLAGGLFQGCVSLVNFEIPSSITTIEDNVFNGCVALQSMIIPENVKELGNKTFYGCNNLKKITIEKSPSGLFTHSDVFTFCPIKSLLLGRNISSCFSENTNLSEVIINSTVTKIPKNAFRGCKDLKSIVIPRSVVEIGEYAFSNSGLEKIIFEDGADDIKFNLEVASWDEQTPHTFSGCKLEDIYLGRNLTISGRAQAPDLGGNPYTFFPTTLRNLTIGDYVNNINLLLLYRHKATSTLSHYPNLTTVHFGMNFKKLPNMADNALLEKISTSSSVPPIVNSFTNSQYMDLNVEIPVGSLAAYQESPVWKNFRNINQKESLLHCFEVDGILYRIISEKTLEVMNKGTEYSGDINIPSKIEYNEVEYEVSSLGEAFKGCSELTSISIPQSVHSLLNNCFKGCSKLKEVIFNGTLEEISAGAFQNCTSLFKIQIPETIKYIRNNAFNGCSKLEEFMCPALLEFIGESAFENCTSLKKISLNSKISIIPQKCFAGCSNLKSVSPLNSIKK